MYIVSGQCKNGADINLRVLSPRDITESWVASRYLKSLLATFFRYFMAVGDATIVIFGQRSIIFSTDPA